MKTRLAALLVVVLAASFASATTTFFGQDLNGNASVRLGATPNATAASNAFLLNLTGVGTEDFESFAPGTGTPLPLIFPGAGTATLTGSGVSVAAQCVGTNGVGRYPTSGCNYLETSSAGFTVSFSSAVAAFGFWATDVGDFGGQLVLTLTGGGAQVINIPNNTTSAADGSVLFFGIIEPLTFTSVTFGNTQAGTDFFGFDDMTVGSLQQVTPRVPEPGSMLLLGTGLVGVARRIRRK